MPDSARDRFGVVCVFQRPLESRVVEAISQLLLRDAHRCDRFGSDVFENRAGSPAEDAAQPLGRRAGDSAGARRDVFQRPLLYLFWRGAGDFALRAVAVGHGHRPVGWRRHRRVLRGGISARGLVFQALPAQVFPGAAAAMDLRGGADAGVGLVCAVRAAQCRVLPGADRVRLRMRDGCCQRDIAGGGKWPMASAGDGRGDRVRARGYGGGCEAQLSFCADGNFGGSGLVMVELGESARFSLTRSQRDSGRGAGAGDSDRNGARTL